MKYGACLVRTRATQWVSTSVRAEELGYDSIWIPEHLVMTVDTESTYPGDLGTPSGAELAQSKPPPNMPIFDAPMALCHIAAATSRIKLGTNVYLPALRHPFVAARAFQTLDHFSEGRALFGVGAGWLEEEYTAVGMDPKTRGARLEESLAVCKRLWSEEVIEHHGEFWDFDAVMFEPKPIQKPWPPIHIGGDSKAAFRRIAEHGDGWLAYQHSPETFAEPYDRLKRAVEANGRDIKSIEISIVGQPSTLDEVEQLEKLGVDRIILMPWARSADGGSVGVLEEFAAKFIAPQ
jgi:probable F420-dependent oxidoreductase